MPKKQIRNGYYYFMLEFKQRQGRNFKSMQEVASAAAPHWARLSANQRQIYNVMAKSDKENQSKQTAIGENLDFVMQDELQKQNQEQKVKTDIENIINKAVKSCEIADHYFYIMHINIFCKCDSSGRYYPAEIAIGRFNLREGIKPTDVFHTLVHPGTLPIGYSNTARIHSEETHQIPPPGPDAENNLEEVFASIISFVTDQNSDGTDIPPIYVYTEKQANIAENVLDYLITYYGSNVLFKIYPLHYMFFILRNNINVKKVWPTISLSILQLEKDVYDFCKGISCEFHESTDTPVHCSRSRVIRFAYIICDNCIKDLEITPICGQHVPYNAVISAGAKRPSSRASVTSSSLHPNESMYETPAGSFMPSRSISRMSSVSETSTIVDESDTTSYRGFDTESQVEDDEDEWQLPKSRGRKGATSTTSSQPQSQSRSQSQLSDDFKSLSMSQTSSDSEYIPKRRPVKISGVMQFAFGSNLNNAPFVGRGRGRGIINKLNQN